MTSIYAPTCTVPHCTNRVGYHKKYTKENGTLGFKWKSACEFHRKIGKMEKNDWKVAEGCENADGHCGFACSCRPDAKLSACQIDVNHIDGNRLNNDPSNLERLCRNCHAQVTIINEHYKNRYTNKTIPSQFHNTFIEEA